MKNPETRLINDDSAKSCRLYMAMELSNRQWKLGFTDRRHKVRRVAIKVRNLAALQEEEFEEFRGQFT